MLRICRNLFIGQTILQNSIRNIRQKHQTEKPRKYQPYLRWTAEDVAQLQRLQSKNLTAKQIANMPYFRANGCSERRIFNKIRQAKFSAKGSTTTIWTQPLIAELKTQWEAGLRRSEIAKLPLFAASGVKLKQISYKLNSMDFVMEILFGLKRKLKN